VTHGLSRYIVACGGLLLRHPAGLGGVRVVETVSVACFWPVIG